jgi:hypothetical protein
MRGDERAWCRVLVRGRRAGRAREMLPAAAPREDEVYNASIRVCSASGNGTPPSTHETTRLLSTRPRKGFFAK